MLELPDHNSNLDITHQICDVNTAKAVTQREAVTILTLFNAFSVHVCRAAHARWQQRLFR